MWRFEPVLLGCVSVVPPPLKCAESFAEFECTLVGVWEFAGGKSVLLVVPGQQEVHWPGYLAWEPWD